MGRAIASRSTSWGNVVVMPAAPITGPGPDFSGESISIEVNPDLVERLERDVITSFKSIAKRGSEVGGILLGQIGTDSRAVRVQDYELVECGYTRGPLYLFSDAEKQRLTAAVRHWKGPDNGLAPVGFFRSNTRKDLVLDDDDVSLMNAYFVDSRNVFLLIKPFSMKPCVASFFTWENGGIQETPGWAQFTFRRSELPRKPAAGPVAAPPRPGPKAAEERVPASIAVKVEIPQAVRVVPVEPPALPLSQEEPPAGSSPILDVPEEITPPPAAAELEARVWEEASGTSAPVPAPAENAETRVPPPIAQELKNRPVGRTVRVEPRTPPPPALRPAAAPAFENAVPAAAQAVSEPPAARRASWAWEEREVAEEELVVPSVPESMAQAAGAEEPHQRFRMIRWISPAVAGFVLFAGGMLFQRWTQLEPSVRKFDSSTLALNVERNAGQLRLSWNRNADLIRRAQKATLFITDGSQTHAVNLNAEELRSGTFVYSPGSSDVAFRLELTSAADGRIVGESIRSLVSRPSALGTLAPVAPKETPALKPEALKEAPAPAKDHTGPPPAAAPADVPPGIE